MRLDNLKIFLSERIPSENRGEAAILEGLVCGLKRVFRKYQITIYSIRLQEDRSYYSHLGKVIGIDSRDSSGTLKKIKLFFQLLISSLAKFFKISVNFNDQLYRGFKSADIILQGHDNVYRHEVKIKDVLTVFFSKRFNKKIFIPAGSIGPFHNCSLLNKIKTRYVLNNADLITLRDKNSAAFLNTFGIKRPFHCLTDLAFLLEPVQVDIPWNENNAIVGFAPTNFVFQSMKFKYGKKLTKQEALNEIREYLIWVANSFDCDVILIPHVYGPEKKQDDRILINEILSGLEKGVRVASLEKRYYSAGELKYLIGKLDLLITCRTHAMIAALGQKTPVIAFTDPDRYKTNGILKGLFNLSECLYFVNTWYLKDLQSVTNKVFYEKERIRLSIDTLSQTAKNLALENIWLMHQQLVNKSNIRAEYS